MAHGVFVTQSVAQDRLTALETAFNAGTAAIIEIYNGTAPADADAAESNTLLAELLCSASIFTSKTDAAPGALGTFAAITNDSSANSSGTATHARIKTQSGGTVVMQLTVGVGATFDINFDDVTFTAGAVIAITSMTVTDPEG